MTYLSLLLGGFLTVVIAVAAPLPDAAVITLAIAGTVAAITGAAVPRIRG